jgi:hypothetical protein
MDGKSRLGRWVLLAIIVVTALIELALAVLSMQADGVKGGQIGRVLLTGWLLWRVWDGAGWARWLLVVLFLAAAAFGVITVVTSPAVQGRPEAVVLLIGLGGIFAAFGIGLASPWVGAYQAARCGGPDAEPVAAADRSPGRQ